jgi:hypothetical protein
MMIIKSIRAIVASFGKARSLLHVGVKERQLLPLSGWLANVSAHALQLQDSSVDLLF